MEENMDNQWPDAFMQLVRENENCPVTQKSMNMLQDIAGLTQLKI